MSRIAVIDLGTNTFNIIIVEVAPDKTYRSLFHTKISVKLGEGGINRGIIDSVPFQRGITALKNYKELIEKYGATEIFAFATSAIRDASNGKLFIEKAKQETGIEVQMISGDKEAELIYYGVHEAVKMSEERSLIIDIGGGSTEFIIANKDKIIWKQSFLLGAARLLEKINPSDPISNEEIKTLTDYLKQDLKPLFDAVKKYPVTELIGASGSFDSLAEMIASQFYSPDMLDDKTEYSFKMEDYEVMYNNILRSTNAERMEMKGLVKMRVDMIVISIILIHFVIDSFKIKKMRLSSYSLKEGVLQQMLNNQL